MALSWMTDVMPNVADGMATVVHSVLHEFFYIVGGRWNKHFGRCWPT